jgi:hypothetical protein
MRFGNIPRMPKAGGGLQTDFSWQRNDGKAMKIRFFAAPGLTACPINLRGFARFFLPTGLRRDAVLAYLCELKKGY